MHDIIVIGKGPAGVSAAIYAARAGLRVLIIARDDGALAKADKVENYYGFEQPLSGRELLERGARQAQRLGAEFVEAEVIGMGYGEGLIVETTDNAYPAKAVILATGADRATPRIRGIADYEGRGVSYCAACDAFFYRGKDVAVLGEGAYALHEAQALAPVAQSVTVLTLGKKAEMPPTEGIRILETPVAALEGDERLEAVALSDGTTLPVSGVFVALGVAGSTALARKVGAAVEGARIVVDADMRTTVPDLFAAGDCTGGLLQIAKAVSDGARAATAAIRHVRKMS